MSQLRTKAYGEGRNFRGLEAFAIRGRLRLARELLGELVEKIETSNAEVLELGCGYWGRNLKALKEEFPTLQFTGVDLSVSSSEQEIELVQADLSTWQPSKKYDVVLSLAVLEHLTEPHKHFELIANSLKLGGLAGLTSPAPQAHLILTTLGRLGIFDREEIRDHKVYYTETGLRLLATVAGLHVESYNTLSLGLNQWILMRKG